MTLGRMRGDEGGRQAGVREIRKRRRSNFLHLDAEQCILLTVHDDPRPALFVLPDPWRPQDLKPQPHGNVPAKESAATSHRPQNHPHPTSLMGPRSRPSYASP